MPNVSRIFLREPKFAEMRRVAWDTFVTFSRLSVGFFELLETEYKDAVARLSSEMSTDNEYDVERPEEALSHHLLALYWWGKLSVNDSTSLLIEFFRVAPSKLRAHAIDYAGRAVKNTGTVAPEIIERLQQLYDSRLRAARQSRNRWDYEEELAALGSWVWSGKFQSKWLLDRLQEMLGFVSELKRFGMHILEELSALSEQFPLETARCLELIVTKESHRLSWHTKPDTIRKILENARKSDSELASTIASLVEDHLLRKGWFEYLTAEPTKPERSNAQSVE